MCGIAGYYSPEPLDNSALFERALRTATKALEHRGPDNEKFWFSDKKNVGFGHRRLGIIDLSDSATQPLASRSGRFIINLNGEIYNYKSIKLELLDAGYTFKSSSDTEVFLNLIELYGLNKALGKTIGAFAFSLWDCHKQKLYLCRDRAGEKPLYYSRIKNCLVFCSELKALTMFPGITKRIDTSSLTNFLKLSYVPGPKSIYKNVYKLPPASIIEADLFANNQQPYTYWSLDTNKKVDISHKEAAIKTSELLDSSIKLQMNSDVPIGIMLSGGTDSSLVTAIMQKYSSIPVKTFTLGFDNQKFDESIKARAIAKFLKTDHNEINLTNNMVCELAHKFAGIYDEPFADQSQWACCVLAEFASKKVKVALTGDGADELFGGYNRHLFIYKYSKVASKLPFILRYSAGNLIDSFSDRQIEKLLKLVPEPFRSKIDTCNFSEKVRKITSVLKCHSETDWYDNLRAKCRNIGQHIKYPSLLNDTQIEKQTDYSLTPLRDAFLRDFHDYLPNNILVKVDRAFMHYGLETRAPFLDHRLISFAMSLTENNKIRNNSGKFLLKTLLESFLPSKLVELPKQGFTMPTADWLRGPLKIWAQDLLHSQNFYDEFFDSQSVINLMSDHISGKQNNQELLWNILSFQSWLEQN